jgi:hypothetical protein
MTNTDLYLTPGGGSTVVGAPNRATFVSIDDSFRSYVQDTNYGGTVTGISPATGVHGAANATVTVTGTGFDARSRATIDGVQVATTLVSGTQLTFVLPLSTYGAAGTKTIGVTSVDGTAEGTATYTVT